MPQLIYASPSARCHASSPSDRPPASGRKSYCAAGSARSSFSVLSDSRSHAPRNMSSSFIADLLADKKHLGEAPILALGPLFLSTLSLHQPPARPCRWRARDRSPAHSASAAFPISLTGMRSLDQRSIASAAAAGLLGSGGSWKLQAIS